MINLTFSISGEKEVLFNKWYWHIWKRIVEFLYHIYTTINDRSFKKTTKLIKLEGNTEEKFYNDANTSQNKSDTILHVSAWQN